MIYLSCILQGCRSSPDPGGSSCAISGEETMRFLRLSLAATLLLALSSPAFALVPRTAFAELGAATW